MRYKWIESQLVEGNYGRSPRRSALKEISYIHAEGIPPER